LVKQRQNNDHSITDFTNNALSNRTRRVPQQHVSGILKRYSADPSKLEGAKLQVKLMRIFAA
jgi:hypothetical protein